MARRIGRERVDLERARNYLAIIWITGATLTCALAIGQSIMGRLTGFEDAFWGWFGPTIFPTLGLIFGAIGGMALDEEPERRTVKRFFFRLAVGLSIAYLLVLLLTMLAEPIAGSHDMRFFIFSNRWLQPLQALVAIALGTLFASRKKSETEPAPERKPRSGRKRLPALFKRRPKA